MNRPDGRLADQLRPLSFSLGIAPHASGSVLVATGDTRVICTAMVEEGGAPDALENLLVSPHTPRTQAGIAELQGRLTEALGRLSAEHRAVVTMFDIQGMAHAEIGKILGVSEGTVRSRLFYAHRQLQGFLSDLHTEGAGV